jgi:hypothetical protein
MKTPMRQGIFEIVSLVIRSEPTGLASQAK